MKEFFFNFQREVKLYNLIDFFYKKLCRLLRQNTHSWQGFLNSSMVKNLPVVWKACVQSLGWEDPLEKEMATHSGSLENPMDRRAWLAIVLGVAKSWTQLSDKIKITT